MCSEIDNNISDKQLSQIKRKHILKYLDFNYWDNVEFDGTSKYIQKLKQIYGKEQDKKLRKENILIVTDQNEHEIENSYGNTIGTRQWLYELEVFARMPKEIENIISREKWVKFLIRHIEICKDNDWELFFSKRNSLVSVIEQEISESKILQEENVSKKCMIIDTGNGGLINKYKLQYKNDCFVEIRRIMGLFRVFIVEELCENFAKELGKNQVDLYMVNWNWAAHHPLFPHTEITSLEYDNRNKFYLPEIKGNENKYTNFLKEIFNDEFELQKFQDITDIPARVEMEPGGMHHLDKKNKYLNVNSGERKTTNQPDDYEHTIYLFGGCVFFGYAVEDGKTLPSYLQRILNKKCKNSKWRVVNYGTWGGYFDWTYKRIYQLEFNPGDIVIVSYAGYMPLGKLWRNYDISSDMINLDTSKEFYYEKMVHCGERGYENVANRFFDIFQERLQTEKKYVGNQFKLIQKDQEKNEYESQVEKYIDGIKCELPNVADKNVGAIVMNCNPFTLGHQYLIEYAAKKVDILIVFVVEENKSFFKFEDRIRLVKKGTEHLKNVYVVPSGNLIISTITFPDYFIKDMPEKVSFDSSKDVNLFGKYIASKLNIKKRFVGEEPIDVVTNEYNNTMQRILPQYGVELEIIPRKKCETEIISASKVRNYLKEKKFDEIKKIVPRTTFEFLNTFKKK